MRRIVDIFIYLLYFMFILIEMPIIGNNSPIKYIAYLIIAIYIALNCKKINNPRFTKLNILTFLLTFLILISGLFGRNNVERNTFLASIVYSLKIIETVFLIEIIVCDKKINEFISDFYKIVLFMTVLNDILILFVPSFDSYYTFYLLGDKFYVSYVHLQLISLYLIHSNISFKKIGDTPLKFILLIIISFLAINAVGCATGLIGLVLLIILNVFLSAKSSLKRKKISILLIFIFVSIFPFIAASIVKYNIVEFFVVDILERDITLSTRTGIFNSISNIMASHWLFGWGCGSEYEIVRRFYGAANIQNGIYSYLINFGMISFGTFLIINLYILFSSRKIDRRKIYILNFLIVFLFISSIEITLIQITYLFWLVLLFALNSSNLNLKKKQEEGIETMNHGGYLWKN